MNIAQAFRRIHDAREPIHLRRGQCAVYCDANCGRYLIVAISDLDKIDHDWLCPICTQQQRDDYLTTTDPTQETP